MASFFGEVIEPPTRAIFDEFSDEEDTTNESELQFSWIGDNEKVLSFIDVFFIFQGKLSLAFAEKFLINENADLIAEIKMIQNESQEENSPEYFKVKSLPSRIYMVDKSVICMVSPSVPPESGYYFCEAISSLLKISKKIIICTNDSVYAYKTENLQELPFAFIQQLNTSHESLEYVAEPFKIPNFITGIPAAVFTWCQIFDKNASAFICYTDKQKLDSITAHPYLSVLTKIQPSIIKNQSTWQTGKMFYGVPDNINESSNLYM